MCLTKIILNLTACQLFSHTFHWTKINSLSVPFLAKSTFRLLFLKQFRVSSFQISMIGLYMKYFQFHHLSSSKMEWLSSNFLFDNLPLFKSLLTRWNILTPKIPEKCATLFLVTNNLYENANRHCSQLNCKNGTPSNGTSPLACCWEAGLPPCRII